MSATIDVDKHMTDEKLKTIFDQFNTDNSENITREEVKVAMERLGKDITE